MYPVGIWAPVPSVIQMQVAMTFAALGRTNLVLARAIEDLEGTPTSELEERRTE